MKYLKIKLEKQQVHALRHHILLTIERYVHTHVCDLLIEECMREISYQLTRMLQNEEQKKYTLKLSGSHALSFLLFADEMSQTDESYIQVLIYEICEQIDRYRNHRLQTTNNFL